jgi:hypothetical protein
MMGHRKGEGLGKQKDGILEPIKAVTIRARQGLGFSIPGLDASTDTWDFSKDVRNMN